jgi:hypothetical protein
MRSRINAILFLVPFLCVSSVLAQSAPQVFYAALTGANVVGSTGSATGFASATLSIVGDQATLDLTTFGLTNITNIALFQGPAGANGPLIVTFTDPANGVVNGRFHRTVTIDSGAAIIVPASPQNYYLLITTTGSPSGAVRGQFNGGNTTYLAGTISGTDTLCNGGTGVPSGIGTFVFALTPDGGGQTYTVRYDILTSGLGGTINALQIGDALSGPGLFVIGANLTSTDGRFAGTNQISAAHALLMKSLPSGIRFTVTTPDKGTACAAAGAIQIAHELFMPVAGTVRGLGNTNYMTDVNLFNNSSTGANADVLMQFFPAGGSTAAAQGITWSTITPRGMGTYRDISTSSFAGVGALRVISAGSVFANARIYNNLSATGGGTFGQFVPGLPRSLALTEGTLVGLPNVLSGSSVFTGAGNARTNVGFFNPGETATTLALELRDANGTVLGQRQFTLQPYMQTQLPLTGGNGLFNAVTGDVANSSVYFLSGSPIFVYASVVDNPTGDASFVTPSISGGGAFGAGQ